MIDNWLYVKNNVIWSYEIHTFNLERTVADPGSTRSEREAGSRCLTCFQLALCKQRLCERAIHLGPQRATLLQSVRRRGRIMPD